MYVIFASFHHNLKNAARHIIALYLKNIKSNYQIFILSWNKIKFFTHLVQKFFFFSFIYLLDIPGNL
jgi:hypothetical protein